MKDEKTSYALTKEEVLMLWGAALGKPATRTNSSADHFRRAAWDYVHAVEAIRAGTTEKFVRLVTIGITLHDDGTATLRWSDDD